LDFTFYNRPLLYYDTAKLTCRCHSCISTECFCVTFLLRDSPMTNSNYCACSHRSVILSNWPC